MRVVQKAADLAHLLEEAQSEAGRAFGNPAVFLEKYIPRAKHIEVQILGDRTATSSICTSAIARCSAAIKRSSKSPPPSPLDDAVRKDLCQAAVSMARAVNYDNAGTVEFLYDLDKREWFFIEVNPRIQVEHTVTEVITGVDLVRSQILIAQGHSRLHGPEIKLPPQEDMPRMGCAVQCRVTTEDPENKFTPDYGKILTYRSTGGYGVRLDGGMGYAARSSRRFTIRCWSKSPPSGGIFEMALQRMDRALREFRIRGVKTNIPFLENVIANPDFPLRPGHHHADRHHARTVPVQPRRDRATKLLAFLGDVIVNGNPQAKGHRLKTAAAAGRCRPNIRAKARRRRARANCCWNWAREKFAEWTQAKKIAGHGHDFSRRAPIAAGHARAVFDMLAVAPAVAWRTPQLFSLEMWGGATFDTAMRFLHEDPWGRCACCASACPTSVFKCSFAAPTPSVTPIIPTTRSRVSSATRPRRASTFSAFSIRSITRRISRRPWTRCRKRTPFARPPSATPATSWTQNGPSIRCKYYLKLARELEKMGAHFLCIKDMAGLCRPFAAHALVKALKEEIGLPIHFHTHDTSGVNSASVLQASEAGVDIVDLAIASMSGSTSQPNLNSIVAALQAHPARHRAGFGRAQRVFRLLGARGRLLRALRHRPAQRHGGGL
jgi:pyruvate carboxylase